MVFLAGGCMDQARHQIDEKVRRATVAGVLDLRDVFQLVVHVSINDRFRSNILSTSGIRRLVMLCRMCVISCIRDPKVRRKFGRDVTFVAKKLSEKSPCRMRHRLAVVDVAGRQLHRQQFPAFIDGQVQFESEKPTHGCLAHLGYSAKNTVSPDSLVAADRQGRRVDEPDAGAGTESRLQIGAQ